MLDKVYKGCIMGGIKGKQDKKLKWLICLSNCSPKPYYVKYGLQTTCSQTKIK